VCQLFDSHLRGHAVLAIPPAGVKRQKHYDLTKVLLHLPKKLTSSLMYSAVEVKYPRAEPTQRKL
jgi:hypothetical protein